MLQLVAWSAKADELPGLGVRVNDRQSKIRSISQMLHMVDEDGGGISAPGLAPGTFIAVNRQDFLARCLPFWPAIELMLSACLDQSPKLGQTCLGYHGLHTSCQ